VTGGQVSESERDIRVGGVGDVSASLFDGIDYTALGHLHGAQVLRPGLRYSGSPIAYSFSEAAHVKGSWLVELDAAGLGAVELVPSPVPRRLSSLRGGLRALLTAPELAAQEGDYLSVVLTDPVRPEDPMLRLRSRFPHVLVLDWQPEGAVADERSYAARMAGRDDLDVVTEFVRHVRGGGSTGTPARSTSRIGRCWLRRSRRAARGGLSMRPHSLRLRAFGPFADEVVVDLDALAASGLFLLHGETGAGKTTLLDGIGFALYGRVPGVRGKDRPAAVRPRRRGRAHRGRARGHPRRATLAHHRSPAQERAKARGKGTTTEQARVHLEELRRAGGRRCRPASTRPPRSSTRCSAMSADQFFQVVLLPQESSPSSCGPTAPARGAAAAAVRDRALQGGEDCSRAPYQHVVRGSRSAPGARCAGATPRPGRGVELPSPLTRDWALRCWRR
jgi:hypothetical protein